MVSLTTSANTREPDADLADDLAVAGRDHGPTGVGRFGRENGHLGAGGRPEGAGLPRDRLRPGQGRFRTGAHPEPELVGVGVRQTDPALVGDDHEERSGPCADLLAELLQGAGPEVGRRRRPRGTRLECHGGPDVGIARDTLGDREGGGLGFVHEALAAHPSEHARAHGDDRDDDDQLQHEHLRREAGAPAPSPTWPLRFVADHGSDRTSPGRWAASTA
jgi:hypothetical protein